MSNTILPSTNVIFIKIHFSVIFKINMNWVIIKLKYKIFKISDQYINFKASFDHFKNSEKYTILKYS